MATDPATLDILRTVSTATLTTILLKAGFRNIWIRGALPIKPGQPRIAGPAFTLSFVPMREDMANPATTTPAVSTRTAIEAAPSGCIMVADARGVTDAGIFGDILCSRMQMRGAAGLITDGVIRDLIGVRDTGLPVWCRGTAAPPSATGLTFTAWQQPARCGGVAVFPDDIIVADEDGAVLIPRSMLATVLRDGPEQERSEAWILDRVRAGEPLPGLYPMNTETKARYQSQTGG